MGRSWQGRRSRRTNTPSLSASERRRLDQDAADLAEADDEVLDAYSRGGVQPPDEPLRAALQPGEYLLTPADCARIAEQLDP